MVNLRPTNDWDRFGSLRHPCKFQPVSRLGSVTARHSSSGHQPNFAASNRGRHLYSAGRPSHRPLGLGPHSNYYCVSVFLIFQFWFQFWNYFLSSISFLIHFTQVASLYKCFSIHLQKHTTLKQSGFSVSFSWSQVITNTVDHWTSIQCMTVMLQQQKLDTVAYNS